jgi:hypothetical protein
MELATEVISVELGYLDITVVDRGHCLFRRFLFCVSFRRSRHLD